MLCANGLRSGAIMPAEASSSVGSSGARNVTESSSPTKR